MNSPGNDGQALLVGGLIAAGVTGVVAYIVAPKGNDLLDVINGWNQRHPEEPFELTPGGHGHHGHGYGAALSR